MLKKIMDNISGDINLEITPKHVKQVKDEIKRINYKRMKTMGIITLIIELINLLFIDMTKVIKYNNHGEIEKLYFIMHLLMLFNSLLVIYLSKRYPQNKEQGIYDYFHIITCVFTMMVVSGIAILNQLTVGNVTIYVGILLTMCSMLLISSPLNIIVYTVPHTFFLVLMYKYIEKSEVFLWNAVHSTVFYMGTIICTKIIYKNYVTQIAKNILLEEINEKILILSNYDSLTGLANRRYFEELVHKDIESNCIIENKAIIAIMDVDFFKDINDKYGHYAGDLILKNVAKVINETIGDTHLIARWGGEEFIFFFQGLSMVEVDIKLNKLRKNIEKSIVKIENKELRITASFGFSELVGKTKEELELSFKQADKALYRAKDIGRNCVVMN